MVSYATSPSCFWRRNMQTALPMGGKMADSGVRQPMTTRATRSGASVKVSGLIDAFF